MNHGNYRTTKFKEEIPVFDDAIKAFVARIGLLFTNYSKKKLNVVLTSSDDALYKLAKNNSGKLEFPFIGVRLDNVELDTSHYNPRILFRRGIAVKDLEGKSYKNFHLMPIKMMMNVKFHCRDIQDRDAFIKGWLFNIVENNVSFDFEDETSEKTFRMSMRVVTTNDIAAGVFDKDVEGVGLLNTMEANVELFTYAGKLGFIKAIDSIRLNIEISDLDKQTSVFEVTPIDIDTPNTIHIVQNAPVNKQVIYIQQIAAPELPIPIEVGTGFIEKPLASETLLLYTPVTPITLDNFFCVARTQIPATAQTIFTVHKIITNPSPPHTEIQIATFTFDPGENDSTLYMTPVLVDRRINPGDFLEIRSPAIQDDTIAEISFTLGGTKSNVPGQPTSVEICTGIIETPLPDESLLIYSPNKIIVLEQSLSVAKALIPAAATTVFSILKNSVEIGTVTFNPGQIDGVLILNASSVVRKLDVTDFLEIKAPAIADSTLAKVAFTLAAYK